LIQPTGGAVNLNGGFISASPLGCEFLGGVAIQLKIYLIVFVGANQSLKSQLPVKCLGLRQGVEADAPAKTALL
jgi:hypothetical protein